MRELDDITGGIVDAALRIHRDLGRGLLESVYEAVLAGALEQRGFQVERQLAVRFEYQGMVSPRLRPTGRSPDQLAPPGRPRSEHW
jgi:iron complex transport system substrate-binding protein